MKEEFKLFVRKKPLLAKYVNSGKTTWQKLYETWNLYGDDDAIWNEFNKKEEDKKEENESFSISNVVDMIKKIDMNQVQNGVNSLQKIIELLQGFSLGSNSNNTTNTYEPRQLFKKFED